MNAVHRLNRIPVRSLSTRCFACSVEAGEWLFGKRYFTENPTKCSVIPNAIDLDRFTFDADARESTREKLGISRNTAVFLNVGRLQYQKNQSFALKVFHRIHLEKPDSILLLAGQGRDRQILEQEATELGIRQQVKFMGVQNDIPSLLSAADMMLFPSRYEGQPLTLLESQSSGLKCIMFENVYEPAVVVPDAMISMPSGSLPDEWSKIAISGLRYHRQSYREQLAGAGYDINELARRMQQFFIDCNRTDK